MADQSNTVIASDYELGRQCFLAYHNTASHYSNYKLTFDEFLKQYGSMTEKYKGSLGLVIRLSDLPMSDVRKAMDGLANVGQGKIPTIPDIKRALLMYAQKRYIDANSGFDFMGFAKAVGGDIVGGAKAVGDSIIDTGKILTLILPILTVGSLIFFVISKTKKASK